MIAGSGLCECVLWAREASMEMTEHHPACPKGSLRGAEERGTAPHSNPAEEVWQAFERGPVIGGEMTQAVARLERRYEELERGAEAFAARLWRALHPDTTEAPPSHEAIIAEVGGIVAEISRLRAENTALAAERDAERAARRDYESCITLETSCIGCARLLSACRTAEERAEKAEAALVAAQPALQLEAIRAGRMRCEGCGLIVVGGHLACGCCLKCCTCFAPEAPHG